ncbi:MAG: bifunctional phosphopantothenoylcysteine decarboxylase/phosphopantothenate--cysteine ligase CoaBC [Bacteroidota bacterium]
MNFEGKHILVAITGSIAAYKTPELVRQFVKAGADVKVIMTPDATKFVSPLVLATVSKNEVHYQISSDAAWNNHVALGLWADLLLIAPCSANTLSKLANGNCDTIVQAVYLSARCKVAIAPAMDEDMYAHPSTQKNMDTLRTFGNVIIPAAFGELASGLIGQGRMPEPSELVNIAHELLFNKVLSGKKILINAGPTYEKIDPVRFIGNFASGKMGIALAQHCANLGAEVQLVLGPSTQTISHKQINITKVVSADEMFNACLSHLPTSDIIILSAAVADYKPTHIADQKIKKTKLEDAPSIQLEKTKDILAHIGKEKKAHQYLVGFALETNNELANAKEKLHTKNANLIVLNSLQDSGAGFGVDTNKITLIEKDNELAFPLMSKKEVARIIVDHIIKAQTCAN